MKIGEIKVPVQNVNLSNVIVGEPGVGKTSLLRQVRECSSDKDIVVDADGEFLETDFITGDLILSEDTFYSQSYSCLAEIKGKADANLISRSIIPVGEGDSKSWNEIARRLSNDILWSVFSMDDSTNQVLLHFVCDASVSELKELLENTSSSRLFELGSEKMLSNVLAILSIYFTPMRYLNPSAGTKGFSLREWIGDENETGTLFMPYSSITADETAPLRQMWCNILMASSFSLSPSRDRRIRLFVDEIASVGRLNALSQVASRGRKYGFSCYLCGQSMHHFVEVYGEKTAKVIFASCGNASVFRTPDPDTADFFSRAIGEQEVIRDQVSYSKGVESITKQQVHDRLVTATEIMELPNCVAYIKLAGVGWQKTGIHVYETYLSEDFIEYSKRCEVRRKQFEGSLIYQSVVNYQHNLDQI